VPTQYYNIHGLKIRSDIELSVLSYFKTDGVEDPDLSVLLENTTESELIPVAPPYLFAGDRKLLHKYKFLFPCNISIENLEGKTVVRFTTLYNKMPRTEVNKVINYILDLKLLQKGFLKIHGATVETDGKGIMIVGLGGCGKSTLSYNFVNKGAKFLSDDMTLIGEKYAYAAPRRIKAFKGVSGIKKMLNGVPFINNRLGIYKTTKPKNITDKTKVNYIFVPRPGKKSIRKMSEKEIFKTMVVLNEYMTNIRDSRNLVIAYCYFNKYDLDNLIRTRDTLLKKFLHGVKVYEITSRNPTETMELIKDTIR